MIEKVFMTYPRFHFILNIDYAVPQIFVQWRYHFIKSVNACYNAALFLIQSTVMGDIIVESIAPI